MTEKAFILWLSTVLITLGSADVVAQGIFKDSFESRVTVIEEILNVTIEPGTTETTPGNEMEIWATGSVATRAIVKRVISNEFGIEGLELTISGGDSVMSLPELQQPLQSAGDRVSLQAQQIGYPLASRWSIHENKWFVKLVTQLGVGYSAYGYARLPQDESQFTAYHAPEEQVDDITTGEFYALPAVQLWGNCSETDADCLNSGEPVLFIHGFQSEGDPFPKPPIIDDNGGGGYWGDFPSSIQQQGYNVFEFKWITNARFQDVAVDLANAIELIHQSTGRNVHIVAHSMGGVLVRTLLQSVEPISFVRAQSIGGKIASITTIGAPHSGLASSDRDMHGVDFPIGQDEDGGDHFLFGNCKQLSCHLLGENTLSGYYAAFFKMHDSPGELAAELANSVVELPAVDIQVLIGFSRFRKLNGPQTAWFYESGKGDLLISGWGQRFHPALAVERWGLELLLREKWDPLLTLPSEGASNYGAARVVEYILGRSSPSDPDVVIEPEQLQDSENTYVPFAHSSGAVNSWVSSAMTYEQALISGSAAPHYIRIEPVHVNADGDGNDAFARVLAWIGEEQIPPDLRANPRVVEEGSTSQLSWDTKNWNETQCVLSGGSLAENPLLTEGGDPSTGAVTVVVEALTTFTLTCGALSDSATVEVVPRGGET